MKARALHVGQPERRFSGGRPLRLVLFLCVFAACGCNSTNATQPETTESANAEARNPEWAVLVNKEMNLWRVTPTFYRCEQFKKSEVAELQRLGIRTSVNLRNFNSDDKELEGSAIKQVRVRINTWSITDKHVVAALAAIQAAQAEGPVVLHCQHGADRTGLVTAMYRIVYQGWTRDAALDELRNGGYGYHSIWKNIPKYIQKVDTEKIRKAVDRRLAEEAAKAG
ncbi:protein tyrosine/serine phosphatase [Ereboglobus sp. PH5-5]|uniref:dual specificity protein phosphatase family protein n=1 Tax=Ereboglobus sp. PH5-5 TaxID=2940529 RepID=UPI0024059349|nr:dual specificity protein phosphatase family protein [Ereboglobus sp. PH5-5]MDF9832855.1 protein tyrosine/serine phosphatase [Ereboglobus sp. PH5-5]